LFFCLGAAVSIDYAAAGVRGKVGLVLKFCIIRGCPNSALHCGDGHPSLPPSLPTPGHKLKMRGVPLSDSRGRRRVYLATVGGEHEGPDAAVDSVITGSHGNSSSQFS